MVDAKTTTLFMNGGSQAVRLPKGFRLPGTTVRVSRQAAGVLLEPMEKRDWPGGYWERLTGLSPLPSDMAAPTTAEPVRPPGDEERPRPRIRGKRPGEHR